MSLSTDQILTWVLVYGYPVLFGVVLVGSIGVPIPTDLLVLTAGGFAAQGELDIALVLALVFAAAVLGDCLVYGLARLAGNAAIGRYGARVGLGPERMATVRARFGAWLGWGVFLTRWLITPLTLPAGVLAGAGRYPLARFLLLDLAGEAIWTAGYGGIGYYFGESASGLLDWASNSKGLLFGIALAAVSATLLVVMLRRQRLAGRSIAPA